MASVKSIIRHSREGGNPASSFAANKEEEKLDPRIRGGDEIRRQKGL